MKQQSKTIRPTFQEKQYLEACKGEIGRCIDPVIWEDQGEKRKYLENQTKDIARKLDKGYNLNGLGWSKTERVEPYAHADLHIMGLHSQQYKKLEGYRNITFLPLVAQKNRRPRVKELNLFLKHNKNCRMWTFTAGPRVNLAGVKPACTWMHRKLSKLNDQPFMRRLGVRFVFRSTEFGELAENGNEDISLHPHMHALMHLERYLRPEDWSYLLRRIQAFWGVYSKDCGKILNPRELVKYCVKPCDLDGLNSVQLIKLYHATKGLRLWETLRDLRKMRRTIREENKKVVMRKGVPQLVPNWNGGASKKDKREVLPLWLKNRTTEVVESEKILGSGSRPTPRIVAWCSPAPVFTPVSEPLFMVHGLDGRNPGEFFKNEIVKRMEHFISVHTKTLTVPETFKNNNEVKNTYESKSKIPPKNPEPERIPKIYAESF
jgi:hypothetical protein